MNRTIETIRFAERMPYETVYRLQIQRRDAIEKHRMANALFLVEHEPVITLGRSFQPRNLLRSRKELEDMGLAVCETDRGGDVTYHGPGQMVAYPILDLQLWRPAIRWYLRALEEVLVRQLSRYGLEGRRMADYTGVWVGNAKVAAIGVGIHNWVTYHGVALNVDPDMSHFAVIVPCGITHKQVTSLKKLLGEAPPLDQVLDDFEREFRTFFLEQSADLPASGKKSS